MAFLQKQPNGQQRSTAHNQAGVVIRYTLRLTLIAIAVCSLPFTTLSKESVSLQLKWKHAFQFAGYYMAKEQGYYDEAGLNVTIIEGSPEQRPLQHIMNSEGHYAVSDSGSLLARAAGNPVIALAAIFQHSPLALAVRSDSDIRTFKGLRGKRVMMQDDKMDAVILAAIYKAGLSNADFIRQKSSFDLNDLILGNTDAFSIYTTDQPQQLKERGVGYRILHPIEYDVDYYGDVLITSEEEIDNHPKRAAAFVNATIKGWHYALEHINEAIDLIQTKYNSQNLSSKHLFFEASKTAEMILKDEIELGYMSEYRWNQIAKTYVNLGLIPEDFVLTGFLYKPKPGFMGIIEHYRWQVIIAVLLLLLTVFALQTVLLRRLVHSRTEDLVKERESLRDRESLQASTSLVLEMIASDKPITDVFDTIVKVFEARYPNMKSSILILKQGKLYKGAAPSLSDEYNAAIEGMETGPTASPCGTAVYSKERVIVEDIAADPRWALFAEAAQSFKLQACWSEPIFHSNGEVLGTFAMYYDHPCSPSEKALKDIHNAAKLAGIAIEKKISEERLRKLSQAVEQSAESVIITNKEGAIEYVNAAFTTITGYLPEEALGNNPRILKSGNQTAEYYKRLWSTITKGETWHSTVIDRRKDGSQYPAMMTISPIVDKRGEITHYVGIQQDMTDHDVLEEQFRQAQKMEALGTLIGGIAHDFNNILTGITGNISIAIHDMQEFPEVTAKLQIAENLGFDAAEMIKQLMAFSRKGLIKMKPFGLISFIEDISALVKTSIPENITFRLEHCNEELVIKGDPTQLQQVLMNMLNNARDAVEGVSEATVLLKIEEFEADEDFINKRPEIDGRLFAHLIVEDNGSGISKTNKAHLFEPFFTTKEVGLGTGLGLSMAYGAIQSHRGTIEVESTLGKGTSFHIYLPLIEERKIDLTSVETIETVSGNGELILIVDDNADVRHAIKDILNRLNYKVLEASDGLEAVDVVTANGDDISLIIMDVVMPRLGGVAAVERIRKICPETKVIFSTGYDKDETLKNDMPSDGHIVLSKPYNFAQLSQMIRSQLDS